MPDETFQPKRRKISPDEIMQQAQRDETVVQSPVENSIANPQPIETKAEQSEMPPSRPDLGGLQVSGNVPEAFKRALSEQREQKRQQQAPKEAPRPMTNAPSEQQEPSIAGKLEDIINRIQLNSTLYETIKLPSLGRFYDGEDGPTDGVLHIRPMTGEEEQILATPRFVKRGQAINMIFDRCIQEQFHSERFITPDRTYLLIYLRGISYTPEYDVEVKCPHCDRKFATVIDLNDLYVNSCPDDFSMTSLSDELPTTKLKFIYRLATGSEEQRVQEYRDRKMRFETNANQADDTLIFRTSLLIENIEGITNKQEIVSIIKKLPISDVAYLRTVVNEPPFGVDTKVTIPCPACLNDFEIELPLEANFFFPRSRKKAKTQA